MRRFIRLVAAVTVAALCGSGPALAQTKAGCVEGKASTPAKVEGEVVKVDHGLDKVTVKGKDGMVHEFQVSKDTLRDLKAGDKIEASLRAAPKCP
jgi:Cu/Ag efflux protein CusF